MTLDMLRAQPRPDDAVAAAGRVRVAWKTGTSWGFRDAWTAGVFGPYVLVVWLGNFDGRAIRPSSAWRPRHRCSSGSSMRSRRTTGERAEPALVAAGLARVEVCAASGDLPNAECPQTRDLVHPGHVADPDQPGASPRVASTRAPATGLPALRSGFTRSEVYEFWPTDLLQLFAQAGMPRDARRRPPMPARPRRAAHRRISPRR